MAKKAIKLASALIVSLTFLVFIIVAEIMAIPAVSSIAGIFVGVLLPFVYRFYQDCTDDLPWKSELRNYSRANILKKSDQIRVSFAYLFRVKIDNKYFLVKNGRGTQKYQPIGGAYKFHNTEREFLTNHFCIADDNFIPIDEYSKDDYRLLVPVKQFKKFVTRFDKTPYRENYSDVSREFKEEVVNKGLLKYSHIKYRFCGRHYSRLEMSRHFGCYELLLADVFEVILSDKQEDALRVLLTQKSDDYIFASAEEILTCGIKPGTNMLVENIADHTRKILQQNEQDLIEVTGSKKVYSVSWGV